MTPSQQREHAARLRALHRPGTPLVLANAWDAASARIIATAGFPAVATTSAGVSWSLGFVDGEQLPVGLLIESVGRIAAVIDVPLTVDAEMGYGQTPDDVCAVVRALAAAGAVGVNIEDGRAAPEILATKLRALRQLAAEIEVPLFLNARTDVYLRGLVDADARLTETERRGTLYAEAGADGLFVPGLADLAALAHLARAVALPLNVLAGAGVPSVAELAQAGVARVSVGCGPMQAALGLTRRIAQELLATGTYAGFRDGAIPVGELNRLFARA